MMLQQCQFARPKKYWVLKGFHSARLQALFETYPDARIIWVHRDPVQVTASRIVLTGELVEALHGHVDWKEQARVHLAASRASFQATLNNPLVNDSRIHHVRYPDFTADPVGTIRGFTRSTACRSALRPRPPCAVICKTTRRTGMESSGIRRT